LNRSSAERGLLVCCPVPQTGSADAGTEKTQVFSTTSAIFSAR